MALSESPAGNVSAFGWRSYRVRRHDKAPLRQFIVDALSDRGCTIRHASNASEAPFYVVFDTPSGERVGVLAYAFFSNSKVTGGRPKDEHRFQIKYGGDLKGILDVATDPAELVTTIFLGIDVERGVFVAADPLMHSPSPMSRSVEFKAHHVEEILSTGWLAWERPRNPPKTRTRATADIDEDVRTEVLIGGRKDRLLDLIQLERMARALDPGERHLLADKLSVRTRLPVASSHRLLEELDIPDAALFDLISGAARLKMAVRGWVAEKHLRDFLSQVPGVSDCERLDAEGQPDIILRWKNGPPLLVECKNVLRKTDAAGRAKIDFQRTRASKSDPCSRYYQATDFPILAACLHAVTESWTFSFAATRELPPHAKCVGRLSSNLVVADPIFTERPEVVFDKCSSLDS